ncbi:MAG: hypothetical protein MK179_13955 [Pirellulaceae bacterium]|nr:hypothetical protein [Pirellulaceae bacterium]
MWKSLMPSRQFLPIVTVLLVVCGLPVNCPAHPDGWKVTEFHPGTEMSDASVHVSRRENIPLPLRADSDPFHVEIADLSCLTFVVDWDRDTALDGLLIRFSPFNEHGELASLEGKLEVSLHVRRDRQGAGRGRVTPKLTLARWQHDISDKDRKMLAYECRFALDDDIFEYQKPLRKYYVTVRFKTGGRTYRATHQAERIVLPHQESNLTK